MQLTFKKKHLAFAMSPIRIANSLTDYGLAAQLKTALTGYEALLPDLSNSETSNDHEQVTITITPERFMQIYQHISNMPEGMTTIFAEDIMEDGEGFTGLKNQVLAGCVAQDADFLLIAESIQAIKDSHVTTFNQHISANLSFIQVLDI